MLSGFEILFQKKFSTQFLPFTDCTWVSDNAIVAVGFDCNPMMFSLNGNQLVFTNKCDDGGKMNQGSQLSGRAMFQGKVKINLIRFLRKLISQILNKTIINLFCEKMIRNF